MGGAEGEGVEVGVRVEAIWFTGTYASDPPAAQGTSGEQGGKRARGEWDENSSTASGKERERKLDDKVRAYYSEALRSSSDGAKKQDVRPRPCRMVQVELYSIWS